MYLGKILTKCLKLNTFSISFQPIGDECEARLLTTCGKKKGL